MKDLPPTSTLRAFEVATRHATFTSASQELHVTQSAVSHQLKHLEALWGLQLFQRGKSLSLTPAGAALAPIVREFFMNLETTLADLREQKGRVRLKVSTTYSFALKWLLPRLPSLAQRHPEILVTLDSSDKAINFSSAEADVAIRFGNGNYPALYSEFLFREQIFPVASPDLLNRFGMPRTPAELLRYPLLTRDGADLVPKWEVWFQHVGLGISPLKESVRFADTNMTIEAALLGQGIALARSGHVESELRDGSLVKLFDVPFPSPVAYYFVCPKGIESRPHIVSFREWLMQEAVNAGLAYE
ncbi:transcriptional regulator GcvA [Pseudomonas yamanorum]|jgi:LysR family glycine cleavage system transcriptional activator|uniref:Transcriptional regulator GcvA n=1 Tax=Pseudomonas yamanorum TaxID=515393 RepID=A0A7Y8F9M4_9PSED|nr:MULTISPECIES: transcriptional regulator GcvA [Pseudomonas]MCS3418689.1 LysR family glycine cleavage system transcriptional activator [Pseudomonas sp. BIGb0558]MCS3438409.1 LysR family glycine cleavage system transcriptional activator [Pseudomonas sp. BIGb0450]NVZ81274.1 transcriptional regulator GcvA [Pseudomonas yamanorum]NWD22415.1 transcriptional regulator GcvA [Pseudomonas yamanorum]NWE13005.1 transcriptional regulator GcvA [Pseudomonas yamanorum]